MAISKIGSDALASGVPSRSQLPAGTVLQVVNATYSTQTATSSSTYADTGLTASITPISATSKILVVVNMTGLYKDTSNTYGAFKLLRGSTQLNIFENGYGYTGGTGATGVGGAGITYLDSPATTSSTTYKVQGASIANSGNIYWCNNGCTSTITLMEIAA